MDIFEKCYSFTSAKEAMRLGLYPFFLPLTENEGTVAEYRGHRLIMCGSNSYLGLTTHPRVRQAAKDAIDRFGTSCTGSRFLNGTLELHEHLERELAKWVGKPASVVFSTGLQTNLGTISAIAGRGDVVILDKDDHASIVDGARLSWGETKRFQHNDMADLERVLAAVPDGKGKLVVVDGVFSMEGDVTPLPELVKTCKKYGARLMVDDAHSMGVLGGGRGTAAHFGLTDQVDLIMGTFSKSFASLGGFIAGDEDVVHYIKHHARALMFSASITAASAAAALAALEVMRDEPERVARVNHIGHRMRRELQDLGFDTGRSTTPIVPIIIGDDYQTMMAWRLLFDRGVFVNTAIPPAVSEGRQLLRTSYMATHTEEQLEFVLSAFKSVVKQVWMLPKGNIRKTTRDIVSVGARSR
ncbi:MAG: aminotransferase class I/II-fold pyridoxal phosphate-dependent enzyme [Chloroflexi bacterium]|nr:aminotransferase class I/II-fold pyridoxal phosphate-dependent enzyme [Chloroflexota bacterium]